MAHIKCRYDIPYCQYHNKNKRLYHDDTWFCDNGDLCDEEYTPAPESPFINPRCIHCVYVSGEFEKNVKQYEFIEDDYNSDIVLKIGREEFNGYNIEYLEIDGRVLIDRSEGND